MLANLKIVVNAQVVYVLNNDLIQYCTTYDVQIDKERNSI